MGDHFVVKPFAIGQLTWPTQPYIPQGSVHALRGEGLAWLIGPQYACWLHTVGPIVRYI